MTSSGRGISLTLILDWDGTVSEHDTLEALAEIGYSHQRKLNSQRSLVSWRELVDAYLADYAKHREEYRPRIADRRTLEDEIDWLESARNVEEQSVRRVAAARIFHNIPEPYLTAKAREAVRNEHVKLRRGWADLFALVEMQNETSMDSTVAKVELGIVSVNWSKHFIRACMSASCEALIGSSTGENKDAIQNRDLFILNDNIENLNIYANEIDLDGMRPDESIRPFKKQDYGTIITVRDKARILEEIRDHNSKIQESTNIVMYVGDSLTDLKCLVEADIGICIRDVPMSPSQEALAEALDRLQIPVWPFTTTPPRLIGTMKSCALRLYHITDFSEVITGLKAALEQDDLS